MGLFKFHAATREDPAMREQVAQLQAEMPYYAGNPGLTAACQADIDRLEASIRSDGGAFRAQAAAEARAGRNNR